MKIPCATRKRINLPLVTYADTSTSPPPPPPNHELMIWAGGAKKAPDILLITS